MRAMFTRAEHVLRPLTPDDQALLWEMVYQALSSPGSDAPDREIVHRPEYARYVEGWGGPNDQGFVAHDKDEGALLGAVWLRAPLEIKPGEPAPELAFVVKSGHRQHGIGASLLTQMVRANPQMTSISLKVGPGSPAVRLLERFGFEITEQSDQSVVLHRAI
ncbi:MAG: GNAT family N-acetyltransferase [Chthoniobacterales bacterium]